MFWGCMKGSLTYGYSLDSPMKGIFLLDLCRRQNVWAYLRRIMEKQRKMESEREKARERQGGPIQLEQGSLCCTSGGEC